MPELLRERSFVSGGLTRRIRWYREEDGDVSHLKTRLAELHGDQDKEAMAEKRDLRRRLAQFKEGGVYMTAATVEILYRAGSRRESILGSASLGNIESDSGYSYMAGVEQELLREAETGVDQLRHALKVNTIPEGETYVPMSALSGQNLRNCA